MPRNRRAVTSCFLGALRDEAERATLGDDLADVGAGDWGEGKVEGGERSGGLAADGDAAGISPEGSDVAPHPGQGGGLILGAEVLDAEVREVEVAERAQAVVGGDDDDVAGGGQVAAVVPVPAAGSAGEPAAVKPHQ